MSAGKRDKRIIIQSPSASQAADGQMVNTWATFATEWAYIKHLSGISAIKADADTSNVKASIQILKRAGINAGMRALFGSTVYDIQTVAPADDRIHLNLTCVVRNAES